MGFWFLMTSPEDVATVQVEILQEGTVVDLVTANPVADSAYGVRLAQTTATLRPGAEFRYRVTVDSNPFMPKDFSENDFRFRTLPSENQGHQFDILLVSCNGIDEYRKKAADPSKVFDMWDRALARINNSERRRVEIGILGGDQVYMDEDHGKLMKACQLADKSRARSIIRSVYLRFWESLSFRKIMSQLPCLLMWDDHDVMDGFGSRLDQYDSNFSETKEWSNYRVLLTEAFFEFQAVRNPGQSKKNAEFFTSFFSWDDLAVVSLDLRSQRNPFRKLQLPMDKKYDGNTLFSNEHLQTIEDFTTQASNSGVSNFLFVSPVTFARMGESIELMLGEAANYLWGSVRWGGWGETRGSRFVRSLFWYFFFLVSFITLQLPIESNPALAPGLVCTVLGTFILLTDRLRGRLETRSGRPIEVRKLHTYPRSDYPFRVWLRIFASVSILLGLISIIGSLVLNGLPSYSRFMQTNNGEAWVLYRVAVFVSSTLFTVTLGSILTTRERLCGGNNQIMLCLTLLGLMYLTWLGLPGTIPGLYLIIQFVAQIIVIFYFLMATLEAWGILNQIAGLDDDVKDAVSSTENKTALHWLYRHISKLKDQANGQVHILSGDIHTGGITKLFLGNSARHPVYQVVSSPIGYPPMPGFVERVTGSDKPIHVNLGDDKFVEGINYFYNSSRNFVVLESSSEKGRRLFEAVFEFENLKNEVRHRLDL